MTAITQDLGMPKGEGDFTIEGHGMEPIPVSARYGSVGRLFTVWFTPNLVPAAFFVGTLASIVGRDGSPPTAIRQRTEPSGAIARTSPVFLASPGASTAQVLT